jgi:hypothetical protein
MFLSCILGSGRKCGAWCDTDQPHHYQNFEVMCTTQDFDEE